MASIMNTETLRTICLQLPAVTEDIKWDEDLVFSIGSKMFCVTSFQESFTASFKVPDDVFDAISHRIGFVPAPYMARAKWVSVSNEADLSRQDWENYVKQSYNLVKTKLTKKQRKDLGIES